MGPEQQQFSASVRSMNDHVVLVERAILQATSPESSNELEADATAQVGKVLDRRHALKTIKLPCVS